MNLLKNSLLNVSGYLIPGLLSIPILGYMSRTLGVEEFGYFSIIMAVVGYASIFDVGITRSIIREVAIYKNDDIEILKILSTSTVIVGSVSFLAAIIVFLLSNEIAVYLKISSDIFDMFVFAVDIVAISIPIFLITQVFTSLLEGKQEFGKLNIYKTISGTLVVSLPAIALFFQKNLIYAVIGLVLARLISILLIIYFIQGYKMILKLDKEVFKRLLNFGGWIAVSNIISPIMSYFDRFILSNNIGANVVGYYTAPSEAIGRLSILPNAIAKTIFPLMSENDANQNKIVRKQAYFLLSIVILFVGFILIYFAHDIVTLWLGEDFAVRSVKIFQILMLGFIFNSIAQVPFTSIQAKGLSKITAYIHLFEFIPYLFLLVVLIDLYGILGAAIAWSVRMFLDLLILIFLDNKSN